MTTYYSKNPKFRLRGLHHFRFQRRGTEPAAAEA